MHKNLLEYKGGKYFYITVLLCCICTAIYASQFDGKQPPNGGTWQGYVLGSTGALLIVWLTALGRRKRNYSSRLGTLQGWVSAHIYLGSGLLIIATLHSAAQLGWNIHSCAYVLMTLVILSGIVGIYFYLKYPGIAVKNRSNSFREALFAELATLNQNARMLSKRCGGDIQKVVDSAINRTSIGGGVFAQLSGQDFSKVYSVEDIASKTKERLVANHDQQKVIDIIANQLPRARKQGLPEVLQELLKILCRRQILLRKLRRDIKIQGWLELWLYIHIPLSIALIFALIIHVVSVFYFW